MDNPDGTYAPQSPDLSGFQAYDHNEPAFPEPYSPPIQPAHTSFDQYQQQPLPIHHSAFPSSHQQQELFDPFAPQDSQFSYPSHSQQNSPMPKSRKPRAHVGDDDFNPGQTNAKAGRPPKKQKEKEAVCNIPAPGIAEGVDVKTKFPVARIKRIMQADEDVGKVSQVTPTAVCK